MKYLGEVEKFRLPAHLEITLWPPSFVRGSRDKARPAAGLVIMATPGQLWYCQRNKICLTTFDWHNDGENVNVNDDDYDDDDDDNDD